MPSGLISHVNGGNLMAASSISLKFLPRPLRKALLDFQKEGVKFGIRKQGRCLIGDEMGLGKTLQAISIAYYYKDAWPLLIVAPSSVKFSWIDEIEKWLPGVEPHDLNLIRSGSDISNLGKAQIHVIGYGLLSLGTSKLLLQALESHKFNVVILDESHYLKTKCAARTQRLHKICKKAKHAILLSGTPSLARPRELYFQLDIVCPGKFDSFNKFVRHYCDAREVYYRGKRHYDTSGASNLNELYYLLKTHVMIRRLKKEVLTQLPPKRRQKVTFDISESTSKYKKELQQTMKDFKKCSAILRGDADDLTIKSPMQEMNRLSTLLYHYTGLVKIGPVLKYIEDLAQGMESKFIVFFRHRLVREAIEEKLVTMKLKYICIAGDVPSGIRGDLVHSFQNDPKVRIAALSIEAASFGLTLTAAHHVVFAELHHTPGVIIQAEDRAHRIGQTLPVNVHYLIARGTVDEILWSMIRRKVYVTSSTLDGKCKELHAEDGDEDQSRQLSACAAWVQDQEEDADDLEDFVMEQLSSKTLKKDQSQRDLRSFFVAMPSSSQSNSLAQKTGSQCENNTREKDVEQGLVAMNSKEKPITVVDSDDDDFSAWDDVDDDILISEVSDSLEIPEERAPGTPNQSQNVDNLGAGGKPAAVLEQDLEEEQCPLKPKMLKFKKVKDGKLSFTGSKSYTKLHRKESKCVHVSPLKFVGNDPESESQTLRGYLDEDCEVEIVKTEQRDDVSEKADCSENSRQKDRSFLESLQEADIECVAFVCKKTPGITQNRSKKSEDMEQKTNDEFDECPHKERQDLKEDAVPNASEVDNTEILADSSCKLESKQEKTFPDKSCSVQSHCLDGSCNLIKTGSISEVENWYQSCNQAEKRLSQEGCTEESVLNQGDLVSKGNGDRGSVSLLNKAGGKYVSHEVNFSNADAKENTDKGKESNTTGNGRRENCCNMQSLEESRGSSSCVGSISNSAKCFLQNDTCKEKMPNKIAPGVTSVCVDDDLSDDCQVTSIRNSQVVSPACSVEDESVGSSRGENSLSSTKSISQNDTCKENEPDKIAAGEAPVCMDDDSSDDFQVSSIRNSQMAPPVCSAQKPSKAKKRKAAKKSKNKTATREVRNRNNGQRAPVEWSCSACTFINDGQLLECSICLTPRVATDGSSCVAKKEDLGLGISNQQSRDDVEMVEDVHVSEVRIDSKNINFASGNGGKNRMIAKHDIDGSGQLAATRKTTEGTAVHDLLIDSKTASRDASPVTKISTVSKEKASVNDYDSHVAEPCLPPWACSVCTFLNMSQMIECSICLTPRRRSQRLSASKNTLTIERQGKDCVNKYKSSKRRRSSGDMAKKNENPQDMELDTVSSSVTCIDDSSGVNSITDCDHGTSVANAEGLTPEQEVSYDADGRQAHGCLEVHLSEDSSGGIKSRPRKRLKLEEVDAGGTTSDDICDFSDDSDSLCDNSAFACSTSVAPLTARKESTPCTPFSDKDITSSGDCVLSTDEDKMELRTHQSPKNFQIDKSDCEVYCDKLDDSVQSVEAIDNIEEPLVVSLSSSSIDDNTTGDNSLSCLQSGSKVEENLEELKAAAEEIFTSEWEDDDCWWEEESCSGQSSFPSSNETMSSSPTVTSPGFTKCSDLYSVTELRSKLQGTPEQTSDSTTTTAYVDNAQQCELVAGNPNNNMPLSSLNQGNLTPETAAVIEEEETDEEEDVPEAMKLKFCLSLYTERVYLYDEDGRPLGINFCVSDVKNGNMEDLPTILHHDENLRQVKRLLEAWKRMGEGKKRILRKSALVFDNPLEAYECARKGITRESSYVRHPSKDSRIQNVIDTAEEIGGKVRVVKKPRVVSNKRNRRADFTVKTISGQSRSTPPLSSSTASTNTTQESTSSTAPSDKTCYQAVRADGIPLCLFCKGPVDFVKNVQCSDWDARFCSYDCNKEYQVRVSGTAARRALFESERGICQLCQLDAHTLYQNITALNVRDRPAFLAQTPYSSLPQQILKKMVMDPKEGMFWEADHITPVSEGGGECGLDNYRTLCVMCHRKATEELNRRLKHRKGLQYAAGYADISTFFRPLS